MSVDRALRSVESAIGETSDPQKLQILYLWRERLQEKQFRDSLKRREKALRAARKAAP